MMGEENVHRSSCLLLLLFVTNIVLHSNCQLPSSKASFESISLGPPRVESSHFCGHIISLMIYASLTSAIPKMMQLVIQYSVI